EDGIRDGHVTGVQTCALPISSGQGSEKELIDALIAGHANRAAGGLMGSNNQARAMRISGDRHLPTIKQVPAGATFRMGELLIGRSEERRVGKECRSRWGR